MLKIHPFSFRFDKDEPRDWKKESIQDNNNLVFVPKKDVVIDKTTLIKRCLNSEDFEDIDSLSLFYSYTNDTSLLKIEIQKELFLKSQTEENQLLKNISEYNSYCDSGSLSLIKESNKTSPSYLLS